MNEVNEVNRIQELEAALEREKKSAMFWCDMASHFEAALDTKEHIIETLNNQNPEHAAYVYLSEKRRRRTRYLIGAALSVREATRLLFSAVAGKEI